MFGNGSIAKGIVVDGMYKGGVWTPVLQFVTASGVQITSGSYLCADGDTRTEYKKIENPKQIDIMYDNSNPELCVAREQYDILHVKMALSFVIGVITVLVGIFGF